jgi:PAS domain S-box-containing protein
LHADRERCWGSDPLFLMNATRYLLHRPLAQGSSSMAHNPAATTSDRFDDNRSGCVSSPWGLPGIAELSNPVLVLDPAGRVCSWNLAMEDLTGIPAERILGGTFPDSLLRPESREETRAILERTIGGREAGPVTLPLVTDAGAQRDLAVWPTHARGSGGEITATALVGLDVSFLQGTAAPGGGVHSRAFSHFSHGVAHLFNNLLMVIHGNLQLVRSFKTEQLDEDTKEIIEDALTATEDGTELVRGLLGVSPRERTAPEVLDLEPVVCEFADVVRGRLPDHTELAVAIESSVEVEIEFAQFKAALFHLVLNARESMSAGGALSVSVAVERIDEARCAEFGTIAPGRYALIEVADSGHGIAPADVKKVREPFFTTKSKSRNLGLGLTFVDDFARNARGGLALESRLGAGTRAVLALPAIEPLSPRPIRTDHSCGVQPGD